MPVMRKVEEANPDPNNKCDIRMEWLKNEQKETRDEN